MLSDSSESISDAHGRADRRVEGFHDLIRLLGERRVRFVVIGVAGGNYYAHAVSVIFTTQDYDLFLAPDPDKLLSAWGACEAAGLSLWAESEPLDMPRDRRVARATRLRRRGRRHSRRAAPTHRGVESGRRTWRTDAVERQV